MASTATLVRCVTASPGAPDHPILQGSVAVPDFGDGNSSSSSSHIGIVGSVAMIPDAADASDDVREEPVTAGIVISPDAGIFVVPDADIDASDAEPDHRIFGAVVLPDAGEDGGGDGGA